MEYCHHDICKEIFNFNRNMDLGCWPLALVLFAAGCINDPVGEDFFNDPSKVMGGFINPVPPISMNISYAISGEYL